MNQPSHKITSHAELDALYGVPSDRSLQKEIDHLDSLCRRFIAASPFMLFASAGAGGLDCSPRGDRPGFVEVADDQTLMIPDRRGNNRIDSLRNVIDNPQVGLLFLIPGVNECLRVNGTARISTAPEDLQRFAIADSLPKTVLVVTVRQAFAQCSRAVLRSGLWTTVAAPSNVPSFGTMLAAHTGGLVDAAEFDAQAALVVRRTLY